MRHILSVEDFDYTNNELEGIFDAADSFREQLDEPETRKMLAQTHFGKQICTLFYEPSTRTRISFEKAAANFGMIAVSTENGRGSLSATKGETLEDTIQIIDQYGFDALVLRHHEIGAAKRAAAVSKNTPIINAGDGKGEHPTQAILDAYTIYKELGRLEDLNVVIAGDLANGRTVRSLAQVLSHYSGNHISFVSIPELQVPENIRQMLITADTSFMETDDMLGALKTADVVYMTRTQTERLEGAEILTKGLTLGAAALKAIRSDAIIMHPGPTAGEVAREVYADPRWKYFPQAGYGIPTRMAEFEMVIS